VVSSGIEELIYRNEVIEFYILTSFNFRVILVNDTTKVTYIVTIGYGYKAVGDRTGFNDYISLAEVCTDIIDIIIIEVKIRYYRYYYIYYHFYI
jgi:hypothetical protein